MLEAVTGLMREAGLRAPDKAQVGVQDRIVEACWTAARLLMHGKQLRRTKVKVWRVELTVGLRRDAA